MNSTKLVEVKIQQTINSAPAIKQKLNDLEITKLNAEREIIGLSSIKNWKSEIRIRCFAALRHFCLRIWCPCLTNDLQRQRLTSFFHIPKCNMCIPDTRVNKVFKCTLAFLCGWVLPLPFLILMIYVFNFHSFYIMWIFGFLAFILSLLLAFCSHFRCYMYIIFPTYLSKKVTWCLMIYAIYITLDGPGQNFQNNSQILARMVVCMNEKLYNATKELVDAATSPLHEILMQINKSLDSVRKIALVIIRGFKLLKDTIMLIINTFIMIFEWLMATRTECNKRLSEPFFRCMIQYDNAYADCQKMGFSILCYIVKGAQSLCGIVKIAELLCIIIQLVKDFFAWTFGPKLGEAIDNIFAVFYFKLSYEYNFYFESMQSRSYGDVVAELFKASYDSLIQYIKNFQTCGALITIFKICYLAFDPVWYIYNFKYFDKHDNYYIGLDFMEIEQKRVKKGKPVLFPLRKEEQKLYVIEGQRTLCSWEKRGLIVNILILFAVTIFCGIIIFVDFLLAFVINLVVNTIKAFKFKSLLNNILRVNVSGEGFMANLYRDLIEAFGWIDKPPSGNDLRLCLKEASEVNTHYLIRIALIILTCLAAIIFKPYVYRIRHSSCNYYYPERKRERAIWLYNHVLRKRIPLLRNLSNKIHDNYGGYNPEYGPSIIDKLGARFGCINDLLICLRYQSKCCMNCAIDAQPYDEFFVKCANYGCTGFYCMDCYKELNGVCAICYRLITYDDEIVSEEEDSSDEEIRVDKRKIIKISKVAERQPLGPYLIPGMSNSKAIKYPILSQPKRQSSMVKPVIR